MNCHDPNDKLNCNFHTFHPANPPSPPHLLVDPSQAIFARFVLPLLTCSKDVTKSRGLGFKGARSWLRPSDRHVSKDRSGASKDLLLGSDCSLTNEHEGWGENHKGFVDHQPLSAWCSALGSLKPPQVQEHYVAQLTNHPSCAANSPHRPVSRLDSSFWRPHSKDLSSCWCS